MAVIDGKSVFYRGYYAMRNLSTSEGIPTGGVFGFASMAIELIKKLEPDYVAVAWDKPKTNIRKRREIYPEYKAGRKKAPPDFYGQIPILQELLDAFGWPMYEIDDYEADDIMGAFAKEAEARGVETCLLTSDLDALQLIGPTTKVYAMKNGLSNIEEFDVAYFEKKYGIRVDQFLDLKSLKGDSSDNLPGVPGVGEKTAIKLLQQYDTLENIYEHLSEMKPTVAKKLEEGKELAFLTKEVGQIWTDIPVKLDWDIADVDDTDLEKVAEILKRLEFTSLVRRLPKYMQAQDEQGSLYFEAAHQTAVSEQPWPAELQLDGPVALAIHEGVVWLSPNGTTAYKKSIVDIDNSVWRALEFAHVVGYDIKELYHQLDEQGVSVRFTDVHDVRQAAFLTDPLRRDRSLAVLTGEDIETEADEMAALWQVHAWQLEAFEHTPRIAQVARELDFPVIWPLFLMEKRGVRIDKSQLEVMSAELAKDLAETEQQMYAIAGYEFNIASPQQLSEVLFTKLQLPTTGIKKSRMGHSTDQKTLDKLRGQHPMIELIEKSRELAKLKNTYVDTLPELADGASRIHTTFSQDVAVTGRLSSNHPNLQNIPVRSEMGRRIREAFIPAEGKVFVSADYSQFELRLAAVLAGDEQLIEDFNSDIDIHAKTASDVYGVPLEQVTKDQRRDAKVINFGVLYGMSPHGLAANTGMTFVQAKEFIEQYFALRAPIRRYIDSLLTKARTDGYVETYYGRRRPTPDVHSSNFMVRQAAERAAANMPIQGTEADLMKRAMVQVEQALSGRADQLLQIHDSILVECDPEAVGEVSAQMKRIMESIAPELPIKLRVDVSTGMNWREV